jgi:hypothetical protein
LGEGIRSVEISAWALKLSNSYRATSSRTRLRAGSQSFPVPRSLHARAHERYQVIAPIRARDSVCHRRERTCRRRGMLDRTLRGYRGRCAVGQWIEHRANMALRSGACRIAAVWLRRHTFLSLNNPVEAGHAARTFTVSIPSTASGRRRVAARNGHHPDSGALHFDLVWSRVVCGAGTALRRSPAERSRRPTGRRARTHAREPAGPGLVAPRQCFRLREQDAPMPVTARQPIP